MYVSRLWRFFVQLTAICTVTCISEGCAPRSLVTSTPPQRGTDYLITWADEPANGLFRVRLEALTKRPICTGAGRWPTKSGHLGGSGLKLVALVAGRSFTYQDTAMEMCMFRECYNPIQKGMSLTSVLTYEGFGIPDELGLKPKALDFDPAPFWCSTANGHIK
jgi:hypothetical protein